MAEQETTRLCVRILRDHFGDIPARVGGELLKQGRLPLARIVRATLVQPKRVANALLVLIQHNLVYHWESASGAETYEINVEELLTRLRYGRYLALTEDLFGPSAVEVLTLLLDHGRVRAGDVVSRMGLDASDHKGRAKASSSLIALLRDGYIKATSIALQISPQDRLMQYEAEEEASLRRVPGARKGPLAAKEIVELKHLARQKLEEETRLVENSGLKTRVRTTSSSKSSKKPKVEEEEYIDEDVFLRVNPEKFNIHIRNQIFAASAAQRYNAHAATVLTAVMNASLPTETTPFSLRSEPISYSSITRSIPAGAPELAGIALPKAQLNRDEDVNVTSIYTKEYVNILCAADNPSVAGRNSAFCMLTMSGNSSSKRVTVEYELIAKRLRATVLDNLVVDKWGTAGLRIVNILRNCGKLDSEQIAKRAMLKKVDVQRFLKDMSTEGIASTFELARSADRAPNRSIFLWFIDTPRTYSSLLHSLYRTLGNILVRQNAELRAVQSILDKRSRTDIQDNVDQFLSRHEREAVDEYFEKRDKLSVLAQRVDESVFVLRDMARDGFAADDPYTAAVLL